MMENTDSDKNRTYYSIGEVASMLGENISLVRYWAGEFDRYIKPVRNRKGNRMFTVSDIKYFRMIHHLVKERGMTLEGARQRLANGASDLERKTEVVSRLRKIREGLVRILEEI